MSWATTKLKYLAAIPIASGLGEAGTQDEPSWPRYVRTTDFAGPTALREDTFASLPPDVANKAMLQYGDVLMTTAGSIGKSTTFLQHNPACFAGFLARFRAAPTVDRRFVAYWMQSAPYWAQVNAGAVRSTIDNFSAGRYQNLELRIPALPEQCRIADFLDREVAKLDGVSNARRRQRLLIAERRDARLSMVIDSASIELIKLSRLLLILRDGTHTPPPRVTEGVPLFTAKNVRGNSLRFTLNDTRVSLTDAAALDKSVVAKTGDLLLSIKGTVGSVAIVPPAMERFTFERNLALLRVDRHRCSPEWLYYAIRSRFVQDEIKLSTTFSAQPGIYLGALSALRIPVPARDAQRLLVQELHNADRQTLQAESAADRSIALLWERKQALITAAVTGQLDVAAKQTVA